MRPSGLGFVDDVSPRGRTWRSVSPPMWATPLEMADEIKIRLAGLSYVTEPVRDGVSVFISVDPNSGLVEGDETDVYITGPKR